MKQSELLVWSVVTVAAWATPALADMTYGFGGLTSNNPGDVLIAEAQLFVDVMDLGSNQVLFTLRNSGPAASSITAVYFDDDQLLSFSALIDKDDNSGDAGVDYSPGASPPNLPGRNLASPAFNTNPNLRYDADPPPGGPNGNGVNPNESLGIRMNLLGSHSFADVLDDLGSGDLRIGIHVQSFDSGGSESLINEDAPMETGNPLPVPGAALLAVVGMSAMGTIRRRSV